MFTKTAILLAITKALDINSPPIVSRSIRPIGSADGNTPCYDLPGSLVTCGSHCWPNCDGITGGSHPDSMHYNHYIVIPEARSCYIDTIDYGRFDAFYSKNSKLNITIDTYVAQDGLCVLDKKGAQLDPGALEGDAYCQIFMQVQMGECDGCPDYQRRVEVYSNRDTGCGLEFYVEPEIVVPEPSPEPEPTPPDETEEDPVDPTPAPGPVIEDDSALKLSTFLAAISASLLLMH